MNKDAARNVKTKLGGAQCLNGLSPRLLDGREGEKLWRGFLGRAS